MAGATWRILVVDDEPDLRELIKLTLSFDDRLEVVDAVGDPDTALHLLDAHETAGGEEHIDLVVLDHWLGGPLTGVDIASRVRGRWPNTKVVLFTAVDDVEVDLRNGTISAVLTKPDLIRLPEVALGVMSE